MNSTDKSNKIVGLSVKRSVNVVMEICGKYGYDML